MSVPLKVYAIYPLFFAEGDCVGALGGRTDLVARCEREAGFRYLDRGSGRHPRCAGPVEQRRITHTLSANLLRHIDLTNRSRLGGMGCRTARQPKAG